MSNFTRPTLPKKGSSFSKRLLSVFFLLFAAVCLGAWSFQDGEEKVTIKENGAPLLTVFKTIKKQTGYSFFYAADYVNDMEKVTLDMRNARVEDVLRKLLGKDYVWVYNENAVSITKKKEEIRKSNLLFLKDSSVTQITVSGSVTDAKGSPIPGATVAVKGTRDGTNTDENGRFSLPGVATNSVLIISSVGFERREVLVKGRTILAKLNVNVNDLDEAVVVAYNTTTQRKNVGAIAVVKKEAIQDLPNRSFDRSLQGLVPGLLVTKGTGQPGGGVGDFVLRGIATGGSPWNGSTARNPLIVIDGIPVQQDPAQLSATPVTFNNPMAQLNPADIENITILKDAAAIALYGSKASNGVILVTTKSGRIGKTVYNFRHQTDFAYRLKDGIETLNQEEYLDLMYETYKNSDPGYWTDERIKSDLIKKFSHKTNGPGDTIFYETPDWQSELYKGNAITTNNNLSISGGNEKNTFYINLEYTKENGIERNTSFDRKAARFNYESKPNQWLKYGINTALSYSIQEYNSQGNTYSLLTSISPLNAIQDEAGNPIYNYGWGFASASDINNSGLMANPLEQSRLNINQNTSYRGVGKLYAEINFLKKFSLGTTFGVNFMLTEAKEKVHPLLASASSAPGIGSIYERIIRNTNIINTNVLRYGTTLRGEHTINALVGQESQAFNNKYLDVKKEGLAANPIADQLNIGTVSIADGNTARQRLLSYFGQVNYNYRDKYFFTASARKDGSSLFGKDNQFGNHWSTGVGWTISEEPLMRRISKVVDYLKIRGSIGSAGNSASILNHLRYDRLLLYNYRGEPVVINDPTSNPGNPAIRWERTFTWDAGIEVKLFGSRVEITADIYKRKTSDLIASNIRVPYITGYIYMTDNIGDVENDGIELAVNLDIIRNNTFRWNLNANWSRNTNKLTRSFYPEEDVTGTYLANGTGKNYNSFYLRKWAGVDPANGRPLWFDSSGKATSDYYAAKPEFVGKPQPDGFGSVTNTFTYKAFEFSFMLYYQYGFQLLDLYKATVLLNDGVNPYINQSREALNRWQKPGDIAENPRRLLFGANLSEFDGGSRVSTRYLHDADFLKLSNVKFSYTLPPRLTSRWKLTAVKFFLQGNNLKLWTKFPGVNPEIAGGVGATSAPYPLQKTYSVGANIIF